MTRPPPVPQENRSPKGVGDKSPSSRDSEHPKERASKPDRASHPEQQGEQGNIKQNTTNQGYQQDR